MRLCQRFDTTSFIRTVITNLLFIQDSHCIRSNHQLFIGRDNHYLHLGIVCRDYSFFTTDLVLFQVDLDTHEFETFAYFATAVALVLADTARKHDDIHTAQSGSISAYILLDAVEVHLFCQK